MPNLIADGAEFSCNFCSGKLKLLVFNSSTNGEGKKIGNQGNCMLLPGGSCTFPPGVPPSPCLGAMSVSKAGQSVVTIDGKDALGDGCTFMCPKGQSITVASPGQKVATHNEAKEGNKTEVESPDAQVSPDQQQMVLSHSKLINSE